MNIKLKKDQGVTLIELLIALAISSILIGAIYWIFVQQQKTYTVQEQVADMQQNMRVAIGRMMREIRMAGFGKVSMVLPGGVTIGGTTYNNVVNPNIPVAGSVTILLGMASTTLIGGIPVPVSVTAIPASNQITVNSLTDSQGNTLFDTGDRKYVSIGGIEIYTIIPPIVGTTLTLSGTLTYNHPVGTPVFSIRAVSYQVDGTQTLLRDEIPRPSTQPQQQPQPEADNIENLQFTYLDANGNPTANPPDIRIVRVSLTARTGMVDPEFKGGVGGEAGGRYRRRVIASNIQLRNMGL